MWSISRHSRKFNTAIVSLLLGLYSNVPEAYGQSPNIVPPSPTAASLGQYGDYPVSNYTGVPSISIPIYTINSGELELPISLSYHASGIRVAQEASWVGLGWALNAGGLITRQINGIDDFEPNKGYTIAVPFVSTSELNNYDYMNDPIDEFRFVGNVDIFDQCKRYASGAEDGEPDIFHFNFFGYHGRMVFKKNQGSVVYEGTAIEQSNLKFRYITATGNFEVTDANGWKFFFGTTEITRSLGETNKITPITSRPSGSVTQDITSGWYLDKVKSPQGDEISFVYGRTGRWIEGQIMAEHTVNFQSDLKVNNAPGFAFSSRSEFQEAQLGVYYYSASSTLTDEVFLKQINFKNGSLLFNRSNRLDRLTYQSSTPSQYLTSIELLQLDGTVVKRVSLSHSYFRNDKVASPDKEKFLRLRLNSVQEGARKPDGTFAYLPSYSFQYDEVPLPEKTSYSVDRWGFYNGADNTSVVPHQYIDLGILSTKVLNQQLTTPIAMLTPRFSQLNGGVRIFGYGANREPHPFNMLAGMLTSIQYPTGGMTKLTYEPNDFYSESEQQFDDTEDYSYQVTSLGTTENEFTLTQDAFVLLDFKLINNNYSENPNATGIMDAMTAVLEKSDGTDLLKFIPSDSQMDGELGGNNNVDQMIANVCVALSPGTYRIKALHGGYTYLDLSLVAKFRYKTLTKKKIAAGLRIKTIESYDNKDGVQLKRKRFIYEKNGESTGRLIQKYQPFIHTTDLLYKLMSSNGNVYQPCCDANSIISPVTYAIGINLPYNFQVRGSLVTPFGTSLQGNVVGYNEVSIVEENSLGENLGKTTYRYKNMPDNYTGTFIPSIPTRRVIDNGQLTVEEFYNRENTLVKKRTHEYRRNEQTALILGGVNTSLRIFGTYARPEYPHLFGGSQVPYLAFYYELWSEWWYPTVITETVYDVNGLNPMTNTTTNQYGNAVHKLVTKTTQITSTGQQLVTTNLYAPDAPSGTATLSTTLEGMSTANIINPIIKQEVKLDGTLVKGSINNYMINQGNVVASTVQELNTSDATYETRTEFQKFDDQGRILQFKDRNGIVTAYIWSYNNEYPVVSAKNVLHLVLKAAIEAAAGTTDLETFWLAHANPTQGDVVWKNFNLNLRNDATLKSAVINTYTFLLHTGMTSETDQNGEVTYYQYDALKRLRYIRNDNGEVVKRFEYVYTN